MKGEVLIVVFLAVPFGFKSLMRMFKFLVGFFFVCLGVAWVDERVCELCEFPSPAGIKVSIQTEHLLGAEGRKTLEKEFKLSSYCLRCRVAPWTVQ